MEDQRAPLSPETERDDPVHRAVGQVLEMCGLNGNTFLISGSRLEMLKVTASNLDILPRQDTTVTGAKLLDITQQVINKLDEIGNDNEGALEFLARQRNFLQETHNLNAAIKELQERGDDLPYTRSFLETLGKKLGLAQLAPVVDNAPRYINTLNDAIRYLSPAGSQPAG